MNDITSRKPDEIMTADIAIIGGGASGLCAAIEARGRGADVVIIEKRPTSGGNISMTEGMIGYCVYSGRHAAAHIMDNME